MNVKKKTIIIALVVVLACVCGFGIYKYVTYRSYCQTHFQSNTKFNGVDCSGLTKDEAIAKLTDEWNKHEFTIKNGDEDMLVISGLSFTYEIDKAISAKLKKSAKLPIFTRLFSSTAQWSVDMTPASGEPNFEDQISSLPIFDNASATKTQNAYLDMSNTDFNIVPEVYGNNIDRTLFEDKIYSLISKDKWSLNYNEKDFYEQPTVKSDSKDLIAQQDYANKYLTQKITYTFSGSSKTITPAELNKLITADDSGNITVNDDAVAAFVDELAGTYSTIGNSIQFPSTVRGTVKVKSYTYGYRIGKDAEIAQLTADLKSKKDVTREPEYSQTGWGWANGGVGTTYVEVDIANQHLWYYKNGSCIVSCDFVSGNVAGGTTTPRGVYSIVSKSRNATLKGKNADGTDYESDVAYWMPFYRGYGLHDAPWRDNFGGNIYRTNGSHGCINMPGGAAGSLYNNLSIGTPVIVI